MYRGKKLFLIINTGYLGDVVLTSKLTRDIKANYPDSFSVFIADSPYIELAKGLPGVDETFEYDRKKCQHLIPFLKFIINFPYKNKIDYAFIPNHKKANRFILAKILGAKKIFGISNLPISEHGKIRIKNPLHERFAYLTADMISCINGKFTNDKDIEYNIPLESQQKIDNYLEQTGIKDNLVAINPQAGDDWKCWNINETIKFAKELINDGKKIALTGVLKDGPEYINAFNEQIGSNNYLNLIGQTSIPDLGALYKRCESVISVDTGSMHMACAVGTPTIALFFRDNHHFWGPLNAEKNPCLFNSDGISAEEVYEEFKKVLNKKEMLSKAQV